MDLEKETVYSHPRYVLVTAARNEETYIGKTVDSVFRQTILPERWVIVDDGSIDGTSRVAAKFMDSGIVSLMRLESDPNYTGFASKVRALNAGIAEVRTRRYDYIGILDADVSLEDDYYENILGKFCRNPKLGIAGGYIHEPDARGIFQPRETNRRRSVAGAIQLYRRACFEDIGGIRSIELGGEDTYAEILARMKGWEVLAFPEFPVLHHKPGRLKRGVVRDRIRMGLLDHALGYHPLYELLKFVKRISERPYVIGSFLRFVGYLWGGVSGRTRVASASEVEFIRSEQIRIIRNFLSTGSLG